MNLKNEIKISKIIIFTLLIINIVIIVFNYSYALFEKTIVQDNVVKLQMGNTKITTTIENYSDNLITLASGESKTLNITLSNITEYDILYQMYYTVESGEGKVFAINATDTTSGTMNNNKTLSITIQNNNASEITIKVATKGALINSSITLENYEYEINVDTEGPVITSLSAAGSGKIKFTATDTGSGVSKYCVNQSQTDTTSCTWLDAVSGEQTTGIIASQNGDYYVHVKDLAGNISHSSIVSISLSLTASGFATEKYGTGGLVAINTSGTLYDGTGTIREYRYSGANVSNYIKFNNGEMWRIVGIFKNSNDEWNLKLTRNTRLSNTELPNTYSYNGTKFTIKSSYYTNGNVYWNSSGTTDNNDWTTAGLQYYLNGTDGYYGTLSTKAKALIDANYTYYLGNVLVSASCSEVNTTLSAYINERGNVVCESSVTEDSQNSNCNIWYGNKSTWNGKVALLYPSDYGYSATNSYWSNTTLCNYTNGAMETSWIYKNSNSLDEWFLSPATTYLKGGTSLNSEGRVWLSNVYFENADGTYNGVRPTLNLLSTAPIDTNHTGSSSDPYIILE